MSPGSRFLEMVKRNQYIPTSLLCFDVDRCRKRSRADIGDGLHPNSVNGVRYEFADGRQLVVVHHLRVPVGHHLARIGRVEDLVTLDKK